MKTKTVLVYSDPGHGWAKVKRSELEKLSIADKITTYSYQRGDHVYLEEDCDLSAYVKALRARGYEIKWREHNANKASRIRNYDHYQKES